MLYENRRCTQSYHRRRGLHYQSVSSTGTELHALDTAGTVSATLVELQELHVLLLGRAEVNVGCMALHVPLPCSAQGPTPRWQEGWTAARGGGSSQKMKYIK